MQGHDDEVERVVAAVWDEPLTDAQRANLARRLADTRFSVRRDLDGALAAHEAARQRLARPGGDRRRRRPAAPPCSPAPGDRPRRCGSPTPSARRPARRPGSSWRGAGRRACSASVACDEAVALARQAAADHADLPGWLARRGIAVHLLNEAHALAYSGRYGEARDAARAGGRAGPGDERHGRVGVVRDGARRDRPRHRAGRRGDPPLPGRRRGRAGGRAGRRAGVGPRRRGPGPPAARRVRAGRRRPAPRRRGRRQPGRHVGRDPRAHASVARRLPRRPVGGARPHPRGRRARAARPGVHLRGGRAQRPRPARRRRPRRSTGCRSSPASIDGPLVQAHAGHAWPLSGRRRRPARPTSSTATRRSTCSASRPRRRPSWPSCTAPRARPGGRRPPSSARPTWPPGPAGSARPSLARGASVEPLTAREREVALLAAGGASSRRDRRTPAPVDADGRHPPGPRLPQARDHRPRRAGAGARPRRRYVAP